MLKKLKKTNQGFTIIEVMIVLAIAALILLIVLLAVPALQRNSRNTSLKSDASAIIGAVSTYQADNDGARVTAVSGTGLVTGTGPAGSSTQARIQAGTTVTTIAAVPGGVVAHGAIQVWPGRQCGNPVTAAGTASARAVAVYYSVETSSAETAGNNNKCIDS